MSDLYMNIVPTLKCENDCAFCVCTDFRRKAQEYGTLDLKKLEKTLESTDNIRDLVIIGGNPFLLEKSYLNRMIDMCYEYLKKPVDLFATLSIPITKVDNPDKVMFHVSYDPCDRVYHNNMLNDIMKLTVNFDLFMVLTKNLLRDYGAKKLVQLTQRIGVPIELQDYEVGFGNDLSLRPEPHELAVFIRELLSYDCHTIALRAARDVYEPGDPASIYDNHSHIMPDGSFLDNGLYTGKAPNVFQSYNEGLEHFLKTYKEPDVCESCKYKDVCQKIYCINTHVCDYDRAFMEEIKWI